MMPQRNAKLVSITGPGTSGDAFISEETGASVWVGSVDVYVQRKRIRGLSDLNSVIEELRVWIPASMTVEEGQQITWVEADEQERTGVVDSLIEAVAVGIAAPQKAVIRRI